jgi:glycosyltransferase involved in cell wall biosynthesis
MGRVLAERYGIETRWFELGTDLDAYPFNGADGREPGLIALYARRETPRRAVDLALAGVANVFERRPGVRLTLFGSAVVGQSPIPCRDLGVAPPAELADLYRRASVGLAFSLTNHSLVAQEMMASGLPMVELRGENVPEVFGRSGELVVLADRDAESIAAAIEQVLDDREAAAAMARRAQSFAEQRTWSAAGERFEEALREFLANPRFADSASN